MGFRVTGAGGVDAEVGATNLALRVQQMPVEFGSLGVYKKSMLSGTMAAGLAANANVFSWRWSAASQLGVVQKVTLDGLSGSATAFAAGFGNVRMMLGRSFTASHTGGTAGTLTGNNGKLRSSMGTTLVGDIRIASTAALGGGTVTLDTDPVGQISLSFGTAVSVQYANTAVLFGEDVGPEHPLVCAQNEGFTIQATVPATGTWQFGASCRWAEVAAF